MANLPFLGPDFALRNSAPLTIMVSKSSGRSSIQPTSYSRKFSETGCIFLSAIFPNGVSAKMSCSISLIALLLLWRRQNRASNGQVHIAKRHVRIFGGIDHCLCRFIRYRFPVFWRSGGGIRVAPDLGCFCQIAQG